jgi:hypothetical protein
VGMYCPRGAGKGDHESHLYEPRMQVRSASADVFFDLFLEGRPESVWRWTGSCPVGVHGRGRSSMVFGARLIESITGDSGLREFRDPVGRSPRHLLGTEFLRASPCSQSLVHEDLRT